ncbi:family 2A encapsulin nanocompartment cargo protein cysteine desulfurase [Pendulispora albinea]|uniref:cysteine desulfurase n=1 Tax=Pendulispora albinea TaxID=2741071 RepID=A0ABZ2M0F4_9BACT
MSTSNRGADLVPAAGAGGASVDTSEGDLAVSVAREIERLANQFFSHGPLGAAGPAVNAAEPALATAQLAPAAPPAPIAPPRVGPHAMNVGGGGLSPGSGNLPPVPGFVHRPPLAASPPPTEREFRAVPTLLAENVGTPGPVELASLGAQSPKGPQEPATPYFLQLAGLPASSSAITPNAPVPGASAPSAPVPVSSKLGVGDAFFVPAVPALASGVGAGEPRAVATTEVPAVASAQGIDAPSASVPPYYLQHAGLPASAAAAPTASAKAPAAPAVSAPAVPSAGAPDLSGVTFDIPFQVGETFFVPTVSTVPSVPSAPSVPSVPFAPEASAVPAVPTSFASALAGADPLTAEVLAPSVPKGATPGQRYEFSPEVVAQPRAPAAPGLFDANVVKRDFPILEERVHGRRLVWLDNAATTQKPQAVIDRLAYYYEHENSNVHRAAHALAARATDAYEAARDKVRRFLNAPSPKNIIFVRGATEGINLVAQSWGRRNIAAGDEIVITWLEHHANIVPWQQLCAEKGARLRVAPVNDRGEVILEEYERLLGPKTRLVSFTQVSNALGTITPAREMVDMAHRYGARVHVDGAQAVSHMPVDVQQLGCEFYTFSGHKIFAPTGIGVVYGSTDELEIMPPWQGGGNMIADVTFEKTTYGPPPSRFEAGTGNIADAVGLGAALDYVSSLGLVNIQRYEHELRLYAEERLARVPGLRMIGTSPEKAGVLSFVLDGLRTEDVGGLLDQEGIAVRSGHHCAQPILRRFGVESTVRASLAPYNTYEDIDALVAALLRLQAGRSSRGI